MNIQLQWSTRVALAATMGLCGACSDGHGADKPPEEPHVPYFEDGNIKLPKAYAERIGLKQVLPELTDIAPVIHVTGTVGFNGRKVAAVGSRIQGRIAEVLVIEGDEVQVGHVLATMESAELGTAQAEVIAANARVTAASLHEQRRKTLLDAGIASKRGAEEATEEASVARANQLAAKQRVQALSGAKAGFGLGRAPLRTPIEGQVIQLHVARGQAVEPSQTAFTIADLSEVWVELAVFERELAAVAVGDRVVVTPQADPEHVFEGRVAHIAAVLDPRSRSAAVRVVVPNPSRELRIGQSVRGEIVVTADRRRALTVPREAVIQIDGKPTVFVATGEDTVVPRQVEVGIRDGKRVEILSGLEAGTPVCAEGTFALKAEIFR